MYYERIVELKRLNRNHASIRITGTPGIGKSTFMVYVYRELKKTKKTKSDGRDDTKKKDFFNGEEEITDPL